MRNPYRLAIFLLCIGVPAAAQNAVNNEARAEIGQCYSACATEIADLEVKMVSFAQDLFWDMWTASGALSEEQWNEFVGLWQNSVCQLQQEAALVALQCRYGCLDLEQKHGTTGRSSARTVFLHEFNQVLAGLRDAGLWTQNFRNRPRPGTPAFDAACTRWVDGATENSIARMPADKRPAQPTKGEAPQ